jgi:hypothetical protein
VKNSGPCRLFHRIRFWPAMSSVRPTRLVLLLGNGRGSNPAAWVCAWLGLKTCNFVMAAGTEEEGENPWHAKIRATSRSKTAEPS